MTRPGLPDVVTCADCGSRQKLAVARFAFGQRGGWRCRPCASPGGAR